MSGLLDSMKSAFSSSGDQGADETDDNEEFFFDKVTREMNFSIACINYDVGSCQYYLGSSNGIKLQLYLFTSLLLFCTLACVLLSMIQCFQLNRLTHLTTSYHVLLAYYNIQSTI